ncbi:hypothetical protein FJZ36_11790 [Candidatus Poribacteria bacterium]|nr:hypothetical protein [Candidatus Poribacteria bacterium]
MKHFLAFVVGVCVVAFAVASTASAVTIYTKNNVLVGANFNDGAGSSDMTLIMQLSAGGKVYVDEGAKVKYIHDPDNMEIKAGWTQVAYDDSKWKDGESGVGFADNDDNTEIPAGRISAWTRYYFDIPDAATVKELILLADYDDQYGAWLNGALIAKSNAWTPDKGEPAWNVSVGGGANRGSCELAKGKPNKARWNCGSIVKTTISATFGGSSGLAVEARGKAAATWGALKSF